MNIYQDILINMDYSKLGENIRLLIDTDTDVPEKKIKKIFRQYDEALGVNDKDRTDLLDALYKSFTGYTIYESMDIIACYYEDDEEEINKNKYEKIGSELFYEKLGDIGNDNLSINLLNIYKEHYGNDDLLDNFMINICGYSMRTITEYMLGIETEYDEELSKIIEKF